jgi:hypothetical protein
MRTANPEDLADALAAFGVARAKSFGAALRASVDVERAVGGPRAETFLHGHIAQSLHGCGHAARVAAWSAWLCLLPRETLTACTYLSGPPAHGVSVVEECQASVVAAFIHDTGRRDERVDPSHGDASADHRGDHLLATIPHARLAADALMAVRLHSRPESAAGPVDQRSRAWAILKDADGLDWGRFGSPTSGYGCDISYLRTQAASDTAAVWIAWHVAQMRPVGGWGDAPAAQLRETVRRAVGPLIADPVAGPVVEALLH